MGHELEGNVIPRNRDGFRELNFSASPMSVRSIYLESVPWPRFSFYLGAARDLQPGLYKPQHLSGD